MHAAAAAATSTTAVARVRGRAAPPPRHRATTPRAAAAASSGDGDVDGDDDDSDARAVKPATAARRVVRRATKDATMEPAPGRKVARASTTSATTKTTTKATTQASAATPKVRKVRKLTADARGNTAKARQVISTERREREAAALERFIKLKGRVTEKASPFAEQGTDERRVQDQLNEQTIMKHSGEAAGERLRRLFAERRQRGLGMVRDRFNDAAPDLDQSSSLSTFGASDAVDSLLESSADVAEQNRRIKEGYSESSLGVNNSIDPFKLAPGEYVVHRKYGIAQFLGHKVLPQETSNGDTKNVAFLFLKYADATAKISPESSRRLLYRYCSPGGLVKPPKLNKLNDKTTWQQREIRTEATIRRLVVNQMCIYLQRLQSVRDPYPDADEEEKAKFAASFPFTLTPDQATAIAEIETDLKQDAPMDRLVIGDVGFGKTEVAMRAMFQVVSAGGGVFMMAPTTVLAKQHAANLAARFRPLGYNVALLNRHVGMKKQDAILNDFRDGKIDIIVGTHKLINLDEEMYKKLKLLVIDEEQRFGVKHKDQISALKAEVDVLTLSATPIPRTLHMAMAGFRDASLVQTPPPERRPINTILAPINDVDIRHAIKHELARNGQIYYIVPRINMMREAVDRLNRMFPDLSIMTAHGQMGGESLDAAMEAFSNGEADCLIATTIVESGLDIPNCNTIIIENVQFFGLASLYQLRGRVGRAGRQAYAYMFYSSEDSELTPQAQERLAALEECCGLGEGFRLSERDMGIRGVGTMFGEKQSGDVDSIGADLYLELLYKQLQRIDKLRIKSVAPDDVMVGTGGYEFGITPFYIATTEASDQIKATVDQMSFAEESQHVLALIKSTFGEPDESSLTCLYAREMKILAGELGIHGILLDNPRDPVIDLITDATIMVKELLVEGVDGLYELEIIDTGIRLPTMTEMSIHNKVMYTVKVLRSIAQSIPSFVKYL